MTKPETLGIGLLPALALAAGLLSGSLFRQPAPAPKADESGGPPSTLADEGSAPGWLGDVRPVMETLGTSMGLTVRRDGTSARAATGRELDRSPVGAPPDLQTQIDVVRAELNRRAIPAASCSTDESAAQAANYLNAWLLAGKPDDRPGQLRRVVTEELLQQRGDLETLSALSARARARQYDVDFLLATIPDYVDSSSGWLADQSLAAIQSAMARADYLLDQVRLVDVPGRSGSEASRHRHERQPGALVFRRVDGDTVHLRVVLIVLETPTTGIHRAALANAARFVASWQGCSQAPRPLRVLGPTFSGSALSMAQVLGDATTNVVGTFPGVVVISGSATADENLGVFERFAPRVTYGTMVRSTGEVMQAMAQYLGQMNPAWGRGEKVALLLESNTAYGGASSRAVRTAVSDATAVAERTPAGRAAAAVRATAAATAAPWPGTVFSFPLHVSQLRSDRPDIPSVSALLPSGAVPLNMGDSVTATDLIPAVRPQLTSPVVESTVETILDAIRHDRIGAVGIQATDERDVLFLAREVKRSSPDVQLFLLGNNAIYLHPDFVPYLRGAVVASPYGLSLPSQKSNRPQQRLEPFQSMASEGLFNATLAQLEREDLLLDYCAPAQDGQSCEPPPVRLSVVGEDGFWPLAFEPAATGYRPQQYVRKHAQDVAPLEPRLPPLPTPARIVLVLLSVAILVHVVLVAFAAARARARGHDPSLLGWPVIRVFVPPVAHDSIRHQHAKAVVFSSLLVGLGAAWVAAIAVPFAPLFDGRAAPGIVAAATVLAFILAMLPAVWLRSIVRRADLRLNLPMPQLPLRGRIAVWVLMVPFLFGIGYFAVVISTVVASGWRPADAQLLLARMTGGGIVSPAPATIGLLISLYAATFTGVRRLSLVGIGYQTLERRRGAFALLTRHDGRPAAGAAGTADDARGGNVSALAGMLDMPVQHLPLPYFLGIGAVMFAIIATVGRVTTVDGRAFSWFLYIGSLTVIAFALIYAAVGLATWLTARSCLRLLAQTPLCRSFQEIAQHVPWNLSLAPPRLMELMPAARLADRLTRQLRAQGDELEAASWMFPARRERRGPHDPAGSLSMSEAGLGVRLADLAPAQSLASGTHVPCLLDEAQERPFAAVIQSATWMQIWDTASALCQILRATVWARCPRPAAAAGAAVTADLAGRVPAGGELDVHGVADNPAADSGTGAAAGWFTQCEQLLALQFAYVARDVASRAVTALFAAMLCATLLTASHLLYAFGGRSALITVDLIAIAATALISTWILIDMERDTVLSQLRHTTPGRVDLNWAFVQRIVVYGVLPIIVVLAALFPEIGGSLFGWLEPLRKLSAF